MHRHVRFVTYTQDSLPSRVSPVGMLMLIAAILLGSGVLPAVAIHFEPTTERLFTLLWLVMYLGAFLGLMFRHGINWISWLLRYRILPALGYPALGLESYEGVQVWRGVFISKNDLGFWSAASVLLFITLSESTRELFWRVFCFVMAGIAVGVLIMSQSATSLMAMLVAGAVALYLYISIRFQLGFVRMVVLAVLMVAIVGLAIANIDTASIVGRTGDLTGRGEVWRQTWKLILDQPLTGYGYGALWFPTGETLRIQESLTDFSWVVYHAHNGFLQVASEVGLPLAMLALLWVVQQMIEIFYCQYQRQQAGVLFVLAFSIAFLISNYSEARFLISRELYWILFLALPISMLRQINDTRVPQGSMAGGARSTVMPGPMGPPGTRHGAAMMHGAMAAAPTPSAAELRERPWLAPRQSARFGAHGSSAAASDPAGAAGADAVVRNTRTEQYSKRSPGEGRRAATALKRSSIGSAGIGSGIVDDGSQEHDDAADVEAEQDVFDMTHTSFDDDRYDLDFDLDFDDASATDDWVDPPDERDR
ncbi:MAG: hypothetical protein CSA54_05255 [Gammaproteobacteria bacterium]|nr:MAG: hypothetical protein CSA54_05255 [Gammaproteobacteria bacterium]